jgi:hypothetical protein
MKIALYFIAGTLAMGLAACSKRTITIKITLFPAELYILENHKLLNSTPVTTGP